MRNISTGNNKLFCEQYWEKVLSKTKPPKEPPKEVSFDWYLTDYNNALLGDISEYTPTNIGEVLAQTDKEFKQLKPTKKPMVLWRGIGNPHITKEEAFIPRFDNIKNKKVGDIICMPEYAYASDEKFYSEGFTKKDGILYKINVPAGAKLSNRLNYIFPRYSRFECVGKNEVKDKEHQYTEICLNYILPEENIPKTNKVHALIDKISNIFKKDK